jgi:type I restriction enzyme S subunit
MEGWREFRLGELVDLKQGFALNKKSDHYLSNDNTGLPLLKISDLIKGTETLFVKSNIPKQFLVTPSEIIYSRTGQVGLAFMGKTGVVYNNCFKVIPSDKIYSVYLFQWLNNPTVRNTISSLATGTAQPDLNHDAFKSVKILLPPLPTQRKIATILSAYDDLIENNLKRIKLLEEKAQLTYEEWFVRMKFPGYETAVFDEESGLPEGWEEMTLEKVAMINAKSIKKGFKGEIEYIDIASVSPGTIESTTRYDYSDAPGRAKRIVEHGDIIWSCVRPNRKSFAVIWNPKDNLIASTGFCVITPKKLPVSYLLQFVTTDDYVGYLTNRAGGAAYPAVKAIDFKESTIRVPSEKLIQEFDSVFKNTLEVAWNLHNQNQLLKEARDILLPRLMSGMVEVDELIGAGMEEIFKKLKEII